MSIRKHHKDGSAPLPLEPVAGNGLLDRRALLGRGIVLAGAVTTGASTALTSAAAEPLTNGPWSLAPGVPIPPYGQPSKFEQKVVRTLSNPKLEPRGSAARTPHHLLNGTITPNGLHFVIARGGETEIDPDKHRLLIHGLVKQSMVYTLDALHRYPMVSRSRSWNAVVTVRRSTPRSLFRPTCRRCTACAPAPSGPALCLPRCSRRSASIQRRSGLSLKERTCRR